MQEPHNWYREINFIAHYFYLKIRQTSLAFLNIFVAAQKQHQSTFLPEMTKMSHSMIMNWSATLPRWPTRDNIEYTQNYSQYCCMFSANTTELHCISDVQLTNSFINQSWHESFSALSHSCCVSSLTILSPQELLYVSK